MFCAQAQGQFEEVVERADSVPSCPSVPHFSPVCLDLFLPSKWFFGLFAERFSKCMILSLLLLILLWVQLVRSPSPFLFVLFPVLYENLFVCLFVSFSVSVVIPLRQGRVSAAHIDLNVHFWNVCREAFHCISSKLLKLLMLLLNHCA